jgi:hypothetical protein
VLASIPPRVVTAEEWKALRTAAIQTNSSVQAIVGSLISEYLWANGYVETDPTDR